MRIKYLYNLYHILFFVIISVSISCIKDPTSSSSYKISKIVYKLGSGHGDISIIDENGKNKTHIAYGGAPKWSPNGDYIAFYGNGLDLIKPDGTDHKVLTQVIPDTGGSVLKNLSWSPDGRKIIFISSREIPWNVHIINTETLEEKRITNGRAWVNPQWSPDGNKVSFTGYTDQDKARGLYIANSDGSGMFRLLKKGYFAYYYWNPKKKEIAFTADLDGSRPYETSVYKGNINGSNIVRLTNTENFNGPYSPDGTKILFFTIKKEFMNSLSVMNTDGSVPKTLVDIDPEKDSVVIARWSPDGNKIAYTMAHKEKPYCSLWVMNADGSNKRKLDEIPEGVYPAVIDFDWSPF